MSSWVALPLVEDSRTGPERVRQHLAYLLLPDDDCSRSTPGPDRHRQASATAERLTSACRTTQCRSCIATSLSLARIRLPVRLEASAIREPSMHAPGQSSGSSVPWPSQEPGATRHGKARAGRGDWARMPGRSISPSTSRGACSICHSPRQSLATTAAIEKAPICLEIPWSPWMWRPAPTSGTSRPSITISGTPTHQHHPRSSTSSGTGARLRRSRSPRSLDTCMC